MSVGHQHPKLTAVMGAMPQSLKGQVLLGFCGLLGYHGFLGYLGSSYLSMKKCDTSLGRDARMPS